MGDRKEYIKKIERTRERFKNKKPGYKTLRVRKSERAMINTFWG